uniref:Ig-like domain-containing protein n=1 Tax=Bos indicus x Bos taurus TaxID=30522 RepID=A0A4W2HC96_BOBOX
MLSSLLRLASLCLLGARYISAEVAQSPSHRVIEKKQAVNLSCDPISGHESLFWYYHAVGKEMKLLIYFLRESMQDDSGMPKGRFTAERMEGTSSTLRVHSAELGDSGVYFCASSRDTVLQSSVLSVQNHILSAPLKSGSPEQKSFPVPPLQGREERNNWN